MKRLPMDVLKENLKPEEWAALERVASLLGRKPFEYSPARREFSPADDWFLVGSRDEGEADDEGETDDGAHEGDSDDDDAYDGTNADGGAEIYVRAGVDLGDEAQESQDTDENHDDDLGLIDLALTCCSILGAHRGELDLDGLIETPPRYRTHTHEVTAADPDAAARLASALREAGYTASSAGEGGLGASVTVSFAASTDWERDREIDNILAISDMVRALAAGKGPKAARP